jgi:energy-coupling factor transporter ATP-binding protein EcfA2
MDFFQICTRENKGVVEVYPDFFVGRSQDLMVRGRSFYAIWDEETNLWSTDEYDVQRIVDQALYKYAEAQKAIGLVCNVKYLRSFNSNGWSQFRRFLQNVSDNSHQLDEILTFANTQTRKSDYVSRRLGYDLSPGSHAAWDELVGTLYSPEERAKIEWAIGAVISGDSKKLQKFLVFYGPGGTGKSTILNIIQQLFAGYYTSFEAKALTGNNNAFATEVFKSNPLVAIQHDGDLSKIEDNTKLNSIISHEEMTVNEKYKAAYTARVNAFLFMGTNKPVRITDAKSGIIRRLIDVHPTGNRFQPDRYHALMMQIGFELGAIAHHCLEVYREMGKNYYNSYRPLEMMLQTDIFFNFIEAHYDIFKEQDGATLKQAYALYKAYVQDTGLEFSLPQYKVREELRNYFSEFHDRFTIDGQSVRSYYRGFTAQPFKSLVAEDKASFSLVMEETTSIFDLEMADCPAQLAKEDGTPEKYWTDEERLINGVFTKPKPWQVVKTTLGEIDTSQVHYVKPPDNHIVIDFDLKDDDGVKSLQRNLEAASSWPATYGEFSRSGSAVHLHYTYDGPIDQLASTYSDGIEIKVFTGNASLRRRLSKCNNVPIATLTGGLPLKEKKMLEVGTIQSEKGLRRLIERNLRKEIQPGTKPSIDFIKQILDEVYLSGMRYDVTDMRARILEFATLSTNQALTCLKTVKQMKFASSEPINPAPEPAPKDDREVFFDIECFPNLFVVCWKFADSPNVVRMINPKPAEIESLFKLKLIGFNNRRYDNHMLWACFMGYTNEQLYRLSVKLISGNVAAFFGEAYNISYTDVYDYSSVKKGLKKFEIDLGIHHLELDLPWDEPVKDEDIPRVVEYCVNDVIALEVVHKSRKADFVARQILAELSGLTVNDTTQRHAARIIFGEDRNPQREFIYTRLATEFDGYEYNRGSSTYRGEVVGEGGYVYAEPGMYENVALLDVASMHPTSIEVLTLFGPAYTRKFAELKQARMAIKHRDYDLAKNLLGGILGKYLDSDADSSALAYALKIIINIVYGLTSAKFDNPFRDVRNVDNIVAKRGALFMIDLKHFVQERGFTVAHIKTDSIKIPDATPEIIREVILFGEKYGYTFEHEKTYDAICLVNDAVYIARVSDTEGDHWTAVGAQFQHPYVFKTLFTGEPITFDDLCETKSVSQGVMYLDFEHDRPMPMVEGMKHVGRTGRFIPVTQNAGGGVLYRIKDDKKYAVTGTKGYLWVEAESAKGLDMSCIDMSYFENLAEEARKAIDYFGEYTRLKGDPPWEQ